MAFRVDASLNIGTGHVMRCLTLADALHKAGAQCHFICRDHPGNLNELIRQRGFLVSVLPQGVDAVVPTEQRVDTQPNYALWLGADWNTDAEQTTVGVGEMAVNWLIVDHYALDIRWEQMIRPVCCHLMVIDDLANRAHDCDLLLDQNLGRYERDYGQLVPKSCTVLAGPTYALLRPEFAGLREESMRRRAIPQLKHLLITMGGVDQADATSRVLQALKECPLPADLNITVVMGEYSPWLQKVRHLSAQMQVPTEIKCNVENMAQLMACSDLAIGAAGGTSWERCCLGLPTLIVALADNQRNGAAALEQTGSVKLIGSVNDIPQVLRSMFNLMLTPDTLSHLSFCSHSITDGQGSSRVVNALIERDCHV